MITNTYIGLDVGDRRIGVAVSHLGTMALPLEVITRDGRELNRIADLARDLDAAAIIAGMPYSLDGTLKPQAEKVQAFLEDLAKRVDTPIETIDERLTTAQANRMLISADRKSKERKQVVDKVAATLILQAYLDRPGSGEAR
ncbi:MAG TPA: Holliday junction resolvase RuvX [Armatimonadota bacterium]